MYKIDVRDRERERVPSDHVNAESAATSFFSLFNVLST